MLSPKDSRDDATVVTGAPNTGTERDQ